MASKQGCFGHGGVLKGSLAFLQKKANMNYFQKVIKASKHISDFKRPNFMFMFINLESKVHKIFEENLASRNGEVLAH